MAVTFQKSPSKAHSEILYEIWNVSHAYIFRKPMLHSFFSEKHEDNTGDAGEP